MPETVTPAPTPSATFTNSPPATSGESIVKLSAAEHQRLRSIEEQFTALQAQRQADIEAASQALAAKETERLAALGRAGELERVFGEQRGELEGRLSTTAGQLTAMHQRYLDREKAVAIAAAIAGREFAGENADVQTKIAGRLRKELESMFEAVEGADGDVVVREKATGRPASHAIPELLKASDMQHYFAPSTRGGSGMDATRSAYTPGHGGSQHPPGSLEWTADRYRASQVNATGLVIKPRG